MALGQTGNKPFLNKSLQWRQNDRDGVSNHQAHEYLFKAQIQENIKAPRPRPLWGEFTVTGEFPTQRVSKVEKVSIWWRHHVMIQCVTRLILASNVECFSMS